MDKKERCQSTKRLIVTFLGTSGALSGEKRDNTYLVFKRSKIVILVDCGGSPVQKLSKVGIDFTKIACIIITHGHVDHLYGLPSLLHSMVMWKRKIPLKIYCPLGIKGQIESLIGIFSLSKKSGFEIDIRGISLAREEFYVHDGLRLYSIPAIHNTPAIGIEIHYDDKKIIYSGDTAPNEALMEVSRRCDLLIHECNFFNKGTADHTNLSDIKMIITKTMPKRVILVHFGYMEDFSEWKEVLEEYSGNVLLADDFMEIEI